MWEIKFRGDADVNANLCFLIRILLCSQRDDVFEAAFHVSSEIIATLAMNHYARYASGFSVPLALVVVMETPLHGDSLLSSVGSFTREVHDVMSILGTVAPIAISSDTDRPIVSLSNLSPPKISFQCSRNLSLMQKHTAIVLIRLITCAIPFHFVD